MSRLAWFVCAVAVLLGVSGCGSSNGSNTPTSPSSPPRGEFAQLDLRVGTGAVASTGRALSVTYTGWLYDPSRPDNKGTQFDAGSYAFVLGAGAVIRGWDTGLVGMQVGGLRRLTIPPELGYGAAGAGQGRIPPNASLVFDVELLSVQ